MKGWKGLRTTLPNTSQPMESDGYQRLIIVHISVGYITAWVGDVKVVVFLGTLWPRSVVMYGLVGLLRLDQSWRHVGFISVIQALHLVSRLAPLDKEYGNKCD